MKITRLVREYVTDEVHKAFYAKENPYAAQAKADEESIRDFKRLLKEQQEAAVKEFVSRHEVYSSWSGGPYGVSSCVPSFHDMETPAMKKSKEWEKDRANKEVRKVRDILVALELGANRDELKAMIEELLNE